MAIKTPNRPARSVAKKASKHNRRDQLLKSYKQAANKSFKVEKENFNNDLVSSKLRKYIHN